MLDKAIQGRQSFGRNRIVTVVYKVKVLDIIELAIHIFAHNSWNVIVKAIISKRNVVAAILDEIIGSFIFAMTAKSHTVIENRSKAYYFVSIRNNKELNVVQMPVIVAGQSVKHKHIAQLFTCAQFVRNIEIFWQFRAAPEIIHRRYHADFF